MQKFKSIKILESDYKRLLSRGTCGDKIYGIVTALLDVAEKAENEEKVEKYI